MLNQSRSMLALLFSLTIFTLPSFAGSKVEICHTPPGNPQQTETITVGENSVPAHMAHGDKVGSCFQSLCPCAGEASEPGQNTYDFKFDDTFDVSADAEGTCEIYTNGASLRNRVGNSQFIDVTAPDMYSAGSCGIGNDYSGDTPITTLEEYEACADLMRTIAFNDNTSCVPDELRNP